MTRITRLTILLVCVACFLLIAPVLVLYSMGDRLDFEKMEITKTGGIYVRTFPSADKIIIDSKTAEKPGMFSGSVFVQSLLPSLHTVLIKKNSYYDYFKTLPVEKEQVTKLENVLLIKKNIQFSVVADQTQSPFTSQQKFIIKNSNLYYSSAPENSALTSTQKSTPVLKKIAAFGLQNNNIVWLGTDGFLYKSDLTNLSAVPVKIILTPLKITKTGSYKIINDGKSIFVNNNGSLLFLNTKTNELDNFYAPISNAKISPDGANIIYYNNSNIFISTIPTAVGKKNILLYKSSGKISDCVWLNNDYIIFADGNKIIISEIDSRGNINTVTLPQTIIVPPEENIDIKNPEISFDQQSGKLYVLTNKTLLLSEKITP